MIKILILKDFLLQCYSGQTRMLDRYAPNEQINWPGQLPDLVINRITQCYPGKFGMEHFSGQDYLNLLPVRVHGAFPYVNPDLQFFQRYFQCFLDFLTALLEVNYNQAFQLQGGKRSRGKRSNIKTRKQRRNKKMRKSFKNNKGKK